MLQHDTQPVLRERGLVVRPLEKRPSLLATRSVLLPAGARCETDEIEIELDKLGFE